MARLFNIKVNGKEYVVEVGDVGKSPFSVTVNGTSYEVEIGEASGEVKSVAPVPSPAPGLTAPTTAPPSASAATTTPAANAERQVLAPMPGLILTVKVSAGDQVKFGDELCTLEAMKMEQAIRTSRAGTIQEVRVSPGQRVVFQQLMFVFAG